MTPVRRLGRLGPWAIARFYRIRDLEVHVEGWQHLPRRGAVLLAARHFHHLYDGAALIDALPRKPTIFVALDWAATPGVRRAMELACKLAGWPMALRATAFERGSSAYDPKDALAYVRRALADGAAILRAGEPLVVFPEGYPAIDVGRARQRGDDEFLPFQGGFLTMVALAQRDRADSQRKHRRLPLRVPIVPVGLSYEPVTTGRKRYRVTVRFGAARFYDPSVDARIPLVREIAEAVRALSLEGSEADVERPYATGSAAVLHDELAATRDALARSRDARVAAFSAARDSLRATQRRLTGLREARRNADAAALRETAKRLADYRDARRP